MRTILLLGEDRQLCARIRTILSDEWQIETAPDWPTVVMRLSSGPPPQLFLCSGRVLDLRATTTIMELRRKGCLIPTGAYLERPTPAQAYLAGQLHRYRVHAIFGPDELESGVRTLLQRVMNDLGATLTRILGVETNLAKRLLVLLDEKPELGVASPDRLASELHCGRSGLYRSLRVAGLPPPGVIQALYRLWPGVARIAAGGRGADAALQAQCPHYHSFRKALLTHFGLTIGQLRAARGLDDVLRRWVDFHRARDVSRSVSHRRFAPFDSQRPSGPLRAAEERARKRP